jgi:thiol-disulfide isomerase/thioredoxin
MLLRTSLIFLICAFFAPAQTKLTPLDEAAFRKLIAAGKGKVLLVDFWATWCKPCRAETPALVSLEAKLRARGFQLITVSADEPEQETAAAKFASEMRVPGTAYIRKAKDDDKFINFVDPKWTGALPAMFLYDRAGRKVKAYFGETPAKEIEAAVTKLL